MCSEEQSYYEYYFSDDTLIDGIKQIQNAEIINIFEVENDKAENEWLINEYAILNGTAEKHTAIVEVYCEVDNENQFFYNGINYFLLVLADEMNELRVVQFNRPTIQLIRDSNISLLNKSSEYYKEELKGIDVLKSAEKGLVTNADGEILEENFKTIMTENENGIMPLTTDPPVLSHYTSYSYPTSIKVKLNQTGNGSVVKVNFTEYMKNVLPNEWIPSWNSEALKAGAYCVKMVGIYRAIKPINSAGGYNITQSTQMYKPGSTLYASTSNAIDSIYNLGMANQAGLLFFPMYKAGTPGSAGTKGSGELKQWGSQKLASEGYTYKQILNYYYSGSEYSAGDICIFGFNINS